MTIRMTFMLIVAAVVLAACDDKKPVQGIATLSSCFATAFEQERDDEPLDASTCDLAFTPTIEPFNP